MKKLICLSIFLLISFASASNYEQKTELTELTLADLENVDVVPEDSCDTCKFWVGLAIKAIESNSTLEEIIKALDGVCDKTVPVKDQPICHTLVKDLIDLLPELYKEVTHLGLATPTEICSFAGRCKVPCCVTQKMPEQVRISYTGIPDEMSVMWSTSISVSGSIVRWGSDPNDLSQSAGATTSTYTNGGWQGVLYQATMTGLEADTVYYYQVGSIAGVDSQSKVFKMKTLPTVDVYSQRPLKFFVIGDMGMHNGNITAIDCMNKQAQAGDFDAVLHLGDISYADGYEATWDTFLRMIEPTASAVPYFVLPGNHECPFNFSSYKHRFTMADSVSESHTNMFYSVDVAGIHFVAIDTESFLNTPEVDDVQLRWLTNDLDHARSKNQSWVIAMGHRPLYCTSHDGANCGIFADYLKARIEGPLYKAQVDITFGAHEHNYEATYPVYNNTPTDTSGHDYINPKAPIYILNGAAGNREGLEKSWVTPPAWSRPDSRISQFGYGYLNFYNSTYLHWQFFNDQDQMQDELSITKQ